MALVAGCAQTDTSIAKIDDPLEPVNRVVHEVNVNLDKGILRPVSRGYGAIPDPVRKGVDNFVDNLQVPRMAMNHLLQGNLEQSATDLGRFVVNTTLGLGGFIDPATNAGLLSSPTDFGETLATWGVPEGFYLELPVFGPNTMRSTAGLVVDFLADPMYYILPSPERDYLIYATAIDLVGKRAAYGDLVDVLLYESADSYAAQRLSYLQLRRRDLAGETNVEDLEDPYAFEY